MHFSDVVSLFARWRRLPNTAGGVRGAGHLRADKSDGVLVAGQSASFVVEPTGEVVA